MNIGNVKENILERNRIQVFSCIPLNDISIVLQNKFIKNLFLHAIARFRMPLYEIRASMFIAN